MCGHTQKTSSDHCRQGAPPQQCLPWIQGCGQEPLPRSLQCPKYIFTPCSYRLQRSCSSCQAANPHLMPLVCQVKTSCEMIPTTVSAAWGLGMLWGHVCEPWHISALAGNTGKPSLATSILSPQKAPRDPGVGQHDGFGLERNGAGAERGGPISALWGLSFPWPGVTVPSQQRPLD